MRDTRVQYFLAYAALGTVVPYASVFFKGSGLTDVHIGIAYAIWSLASVFSPALMTRLADGRHDPRRLVAAASVVSGAALVLMSASAGAIAIFGFWTLYCLASMPVFPLLDGIHFSQQRRNRERGEPVLPYHLARVWGTIGYMVPNAALLWFLANDRVSLHGVLLIGSAILAVAAAQAGLLFDPRSASHNTHDTTTGVLEDPAPGDLREKPPTFAAAASLFSPRLFAFTAAVILMNMTAAVHSAWYPVYLNKQVRLRDQWLGLTAVISAFCEMLVVFACGWLIARGGLKRLLLFSMLAIALRMALLASSTNVVIAVGTQAFHGLLVLAVGVLPQAIFDDSAEDHFRHSMQGVLVMVTYTFRAVASLLAGKLAAFSLSATFFCTTGMCLAAAALVWVGFHERAIRSGGDEPRREADAVTAAAAERADLA
jgi:PPP family 3-phenylpropionic acid transporter